MATNKVEEKKKIDKKLGELNSLIEPYKFAYIDPLLDVEFLDKNARYMTKDQMERLTANVSKDGFLSQLPFMMKRADNGKYIALSGNHRLKSAIKAGLNFVMVQYIDEVDKEKALAIQLSHNSITGQDDKAILKELYDMIENLDGKEYSGINELDIKGYQEIMLPSINEDDIKLYEVKFLFNTLDKEKVEKILMKLNDMPLNKETDSVAFVDFHKFFELMSDMKDKLNIKNNTIAFMKIMEICENYIEQPELTKVITPNFNNNGQGN